MSILNIETYYDPKYILDQCKKYFNKLIEDNELRIVYINDEKLILNPMEIYAMQELFLYNLKQYGDIVYNKFSKLVEIDQDIFDSVTKDMNLYSNFSGDVELLDDIEIELSQNG